VSHAEDGKLGTPGDTQARREQILELAIGPPFEPEEGVIEIVTRSGLRLRWLLVDTKAGLYKLVSL
jgi:hypothetical protein